jgi:hypothetical protein
MPPASFLDALQVIGDFVTVYSSKINNVRGQSYQNFFMEICSDLRKLATIEVKLLILPIKVININRLSRSLRKRTSRYRLFKRDACAGFEERDPYLRAMAPSPFGGYPELIGARNLPLWGRRYRSRDTGAPLPEFFKTEAP